MNDARSELLRRARAGDRHALRRLGRLLPPRPSVERVGHRTGVPPSAPWRLERRALSASDWDLLAADDERIYLTTAHGLLAVDAAALAVSWRNRATGDVVRVDDRLTLWWSGRLQSLDPATGAVVASRLPDSRLVTAAGEGDRVAAVEVRPESIRLVVLRAATLEVIWSRGLVDRPLRVEVCGDRVVVLGKALFHPGATLEVYDGESGQSLWSHTFEGEAPVWGAADAAGVLVYWNSRYIELGLETGGEVLHDYSFASEGEVYLAPSFVLFVRGGDLDCVAREAGRPLWSAPLPRPSRGEFLVAGEHVWSLGVRAGRGGQEAVIVAYEVTTGLDVKRFVIPLGAAPQKRPRIVALDGALLLLVGTEDELTVIRIEEDGPHA